MATERANKIVFNYWLAVTPRKVTDIKNMLNRNFDLENYLLYIIANFTMNNWSNYNEAYKWFYICDQLPDEMDYSDGNESEKDKCKFELALLEAYFLSIAQFKKAKLDADNWKKEFWN